MKLAIIAMSTFGYFERLAEIISQKGTPTTFFDERPENDVLAKLKYRLLPKKIVRYIVKYHTRAICEQIVDQGFTHVLVVFLEVLSRSDIEYLKSNGIRLTRYTWDSVRNRPRVLQFDDLMEAIGSFDPDDCEKFGYTYIPLYSEVINSDDVRLLKQRDFDFYFCGTMHSTRPILIHDIENIAKRRGWSIKLNLFYHSKWLYIVRNLLSRKALRLKSQISDRSVPHADTLLYSQSSRVVIDIQHPGQNGLTMRTFEALAQGAILATTNHNASNLLDLDFPCRVSILDPYNLEVSLEKALMLDPVSLNEEQCYTLSRDRYIRQLLNLVESEK